MPVLIMTHILFYFLYFYQFVVCPTINSYSQVVFQQLYSAAASVFRNTSGMAAMQGMVSICSFLSLTLIRAHSYFYLTPAVDGATIAYVWPVVTSHGRSSFLPWNVPAIPTSASDAAGETCTD